MSLWIPVTIAAALFQTLRFVLQKTLSQTTLSASGATFARFFYSAPLVALLLGAYISVTGQALPSMGVVFWLYGAVGGLAQIIATLCVVLLFQARNFAVGITFKKTETVQAVLVGFVVLGESVSLLGFAAILLGVLGVLLLSAPPEQAEWRLSHLANRAAGLGLASGVLFAVSAVCYRGASLELAGEDIWLRAGTTLAAVTAMQFIAMGTWLAIRARPELVAVWHARRVAIWVGLMSMGGSFCWFVAFTLQNAAYVKAVGQIELIFSALVTILVFRERVVMREWVGIAVLGASILALVLVSS